MAQIVTDTCRVDVWLCGWRGLAAPLTVVSEQSFVSVKLLSCCEPGIVLQQLNVKKESPYISAFSTTWMGLGLRGICLEPGRLKTGVPASASDSSSNNPFE